MRIEECLPVEGRPGKGTLFAVYVMRHAKGPVEAASAKEHEHEVSPLLEAPSIAGVVRLLPTLTVRDENGNWSKEYQVSVMKDMSIPGPDAK